MMETLKPVAWLISNDAGDREVELYRHGSVAVTTADEADGWSATPLYTHPPTAPLTDAALVEAVARAIVQIHTERRCRFEGMSEQELADAVYCQTENGWDLWEPEATAALAVAIPALRAGIAEAIERAVIVGGLEPIATRQCKLIAQQIREGKL